MSVFPNFYGIGTYSSETFCVRSFFFQIKNSLCDFEAEDDFWKRILGVSFFLSCPVFDLPTKERKIGIGFKWASLKQYFGTAGTLLNEEKITI